MRVIDVAVSPDASTRSTRLTTPPDLIRSSTALRVFSEDGPIVPATITTLPSRSCAEPLHNKGVSRAPDSPDSRFDGLDQAARRQSPDPMRLVAHRGQRWR